MALYRDLTVGSVRTHLLRFALPLIVSNFFQAMYNAVDMFFVGKYAGKAALSSVSVCGPIMNIMIMTISGLSIGVSILIGMHVGDGDREEVKNTGNTAIAFYFLLSLFFAAVGWFLTPTLLGLVNTPEPALEGAIQYLRTIFVGALFMFGYNLICAFQRGFGDSRSSMMFIIAATVTNVILDYVLISKLDMGAFGAAAATVFAQAVSFVGGIVYFRVKKHIITFRLREITIKQKSLKDILKMGLPAAMHQLLLNISFMILSGIANGFGLDASAGYGIGIKIDSFALLAGDAINSALSSFVSQNVGAGKHARTDEGLREAEKLGVAISFCVSVAVFILAPQIASLFNRDAEVISYASTYLRVACLFYPLFSYVYAQTGYIRGTGNTIQNLKNVFFSQYATRIPVALIATRLFGFVGVAMAFGAGPMFSLANYTFYIKRYRKRRDSVDPTSRNRKSV